MMPERNKQNKENRENSMEKAARQGRFFCVYRPAQREIYRSDGKRAAEKAVFLPNLKLLEIGSNWHILDLNLLEIWK